MPLRDHFRPPLAQERSWDELHGGWPMMIVAALGRRLPPGYVAGLRVHLGPFFEIDDASYEKDRRRLPAPNGGAALPDQDEYEVLVHDTRYARRLVAAVEIVSPANKDRPESRRLFVTKCAALLRQHVCVALVDLVTIRRANLYSDLLDLLGQSDPSLGPEPPALYVASCRWRRVEEISQLETWAQPLVLGQPLPTLPLWLTDDVAVPLELEASYEESCRILQIP